MEIVKHYARLIGFNDFGTPCEFTAPMGLRLLRIIEYHARLSHRSEDKMTDDSWERFLRFVVQTKGDWSVVEHASASVDVLFDRGVQQEWTRHRLSSYTIQSTRFVNHAKKMPPTFVYPDANMKDPNDAWGRAMKACEDSYQELIAYGNAPQIARSVFPLALASRGGITANLRTWRHELIMRTTKEAHPQIKELMIGLLEEFQQKIPILYDDIIPGQAQAEAIKKAR